MAEQERAGVTPNSVADVVVRARLFASIRDGVIEALDDPKTPPAQALAVFVLLLIYLSVFLLVIEYRYPAFAQQHTTTLDTISNVILTLFGVELIVRLLCYRRPIKYLLSWMGLVDVLAVVPGAIALAVPLAPNLSWLRVLRLFRLLRLFKFFRASRGQHGLFGGITRRLLPFVAIAVGFKGLLVCVENREWWPNLEGLALIVTVTGFAIGILLGTKLGVAQRRLNEIEDTVARIVGAVRDISRADGEVDRRLRDWTVGFERALTSGTEESRADAKRLIDALESALEAAGIGGPVTANLHRDAEFVLHRSASRTPRTYEQFLIKVTMIYSAIVIVAIPGLTGFLSATLVIYVLGGMYVLIDDMDDLLERGSQSLIVANFDPLLEYNRSGGT